jgi:hypothetical protein
VVENNGALAPLIDAILFSPEDCDQTDDDLGLILPQRDEQSNRVM